MRNNGISRMRPKTQEKVYKTDKFTPCLLCGATDTALSREASSALWICDGGCRKDANDVNDANL